LSNKDLFGAARVVLSIMGLTRVVQWLDHLDAMCTRAWRAQCAAGLDINSSRGPGKARPPA